MKDLNNILNVSAKILRKGLRLQWIYIFPPEMEVFVAQYTAATTEGKRRFGQSAAAGQIQSPYATKTILAPKVLPERFIANNLRHRFTGKHYKALKFSSRCRCFGETENLQIKLQSVVLWLNGTLLFPL